MQASNISYYALPNLYCLKIAATKQKIMNDKTLHLVIIDTLCEHYGITKKELFSSTRKSQVVFVRHLCIAVIRKQTAMTLSQIGQLFGGRDHTTAIHAINSMKIRVEVEDVRKDEVSYFMNFDYSQSIKENTLQFMLDGKEVEK